MVYERVRGWTSGRSLPVQNFVKYPPGPGLFLDEPLLFISSGREELYIEITSFPTKSFLTKLFRFLQKIKGSSFS